MKTARIIVLSKQKTINYLIKLKNLIMIYSNLKYVILVMFSTFSIVTISAQKLYISAQSGYSYATNSGQLGMTKWTDSNEGGQVELMRSALGQGINTALAVGYMMNDNLALEFGTNYIFNSVTSTNKINNDFYFSELTTGVSAQMLQLSPKLVFNLNNSSKFNPYVKIGGTVGIGNISVKIEEMTKTDFATRKGEEETLYNGGFGFNAGIGGNYKINDKISIFSELSFLSMSYAPTKSEIIKLEINDVDELANLTTNYKETVFSQDYEWNNTMNDENEPRQMLKVYLPFSNISLNIGLKINL
jgi:outer membrane protein W